MLVRFDPFHDFDRFTRQVWRSGSITSPVPVDVVRKDGQYVVNFDLPGVKPEDVEVTVEKKVLTVTASRHWESQEEGEVLVAERGKGSYTRRIFLGQGLDTDHVQATYDNGVLAVTIPVAEGFHPRRVEVTSGDSGKALESPQAA